MAQRSANVNEAEFLISCNAAAGGVRQDFINSYRWRGTCSFVVHSDEVPDPERSSIRFDVHHASCFHLLSFDLVWLSDESIVKTQRSANAWLTLLAASQYCNRITRRSCQRNVVRLTRITKDLTFSHECFMTRRPTTRQWKATCKNESKRKNKLFLSDDRSMDNFMGSFVFDKIDFELHEYLDLSLTWAEVNN